MVSFPRVSSSKPRMHSSSSIYVLHALPIQLLLFGHTNIWETLKLLIMLVMTDRAWFNANEWKAGPSRAGTVELHLSVLNGKACRPDMQKIRIIWFFFENRLHWQYEFSCYYLQYVPASKPFDYAWFGVLEAIPLSCTWSENRLFQVSCVEFSTNLATGPSRLG